MLRCDCLTLVTSMAHMEHRDPTCGDSYCNSPHSHASPDAQGAKSKELRTAPSSSPDAVIWAVSGSAVGQRSLTTVLCVLVPPIIMWLPRRGKAEGYDGMQLQQGRGCSQNDDNSDR